MEGLYGVEKYRLPNEVLEKIKNAATKEDSELIELNWIKNNIETGKVKPYNSKEARNIWLTTGWTEILKLITGASANHFDATNATIGVGNDATAAAAGQTDLIGASKTYKGMESGYPTTPASGTVQYKAKFLTSEANFAHAELVLKNSVSSVCWNRNATGWGTKTSSEVWYYTLTLGTA